jgi:hypothetical protein
VDVTVVCPLCRSDDVEILTGIPAIVLCKCRKVQDGVDNHSLQPTLLAPFLFKKPPEAKV